MITPTPRQARWAVSVIFAVHGAASGSFASRIPWIADHLHLTSGQLGMALVMPAVGSLSTMPFAGRLVSKWGGRTATRVLISLWAIALMVVALAPDRWALMVLLLLLGAAAGTSDMAMNAEGVAVEKALGRSIMSGLHGMWSVGGLVGAAIGAGAAHLSISAPVNLAVVGFLLLIVGATAGRWLLEAAQADGEAEAPRFSLPRGPVLIIGLIGFCAVFAEGASADWSAVYLRRVLDQSESASAVAYATFAFSMAAGRLAGDFLVRRFGAVRTVRVTGLLGVAGGALVVAAASADSPSLATAGFGLIGIGVAVVVPLAFSAAGHTAEHPASAIAGVATVSYGAGLAAPGLMGGIAQLTSLPIAFGLVTCLIVLVVLGAGRLGAAEITHATPVSS